MKDDELAGLPPMPSERIGAVAQSLPGPAASPDVLLTSSCLGASLVTLGGRVIGEWPRPSARRLCQIVLTSPGPAGRPRTSVQSPCSRHLAARRQPRSLYRALSMARLTLRKLGPQAAGLLRADAKQIWADPGVRPRRSTLTSHERALRTALLAEPGLARDSSLARAAGDPRESRSRTSQRPSGRTRYGTALSTCARKRASSWPATAGGVSAGPSRGGAAGMAGLPRG